MTTEEDGNTLDGVAPEKFVPELEAQGANIVGLNCSVGPAAMLETIERMAQVATTRLSAQPNAGSPREVEGRNIYLCSPEYMASYARRFINNGVRLVGGCCGTTPDHIRQIKSAVRALAPATPAKDKSTGRRPGRCPRSASFRAPRSRGWRTSWPAAASSSRSSCCRREAMTRTGLIEQARQLRIHGVDLVNIPDGPRAGARMSALSASVLVQQQSGIETILHYACRDRNLLGMQSDLLGAHSMGIRNVLLITGDPPPAGDYPDATAVFDVDSIGLTNVVTRLNRGLDIGGQPIGMPTAFHIGVAVNPCALDLDHEFRRFKYKVEAGAEFAITQPVFDVAPLVAFLERSGAGIPVLAAITPLESLRHAEFMANEVPGVCVPPAIVERMREAEQHGRAASEGLAIASELAAGVRPYVQGIQISTAVGAVESALGVMKALAA